MASSPVSIRNQTRAQGLKRNILVSYASTLVLAGLGFFTTPFLVTHLGKAKYGVWTLELSVLIYLGLLDAGLYTSISKRVAEYLAQNDKAKLETALGTAQAIYLCLIPIALIIVVGLCLGLNHLFRIPLDLQDQARLLLLFLGFNQCFTFLALSRNAVLFGAGRLDLALSASTVTGAILTLLNLVIGVTGAPLAWLGCAAIFTTLGNVLWTQKLLHRFLPDIKISLSASRLPMAKDLLGFGLRNAYISILGTIAFCSDTLMIGLLLPISQVAQYAIASKLVNLINMLSVKPINALIPAYARAQAQEDQEQLFSLLTRSIAYSCAVCLPVSVACVVFPHALIRAWIGENYETSGDILRWLSIWTLIALPGHAVSTMLTGTERNKLLARFYTVSAFVNLAFSFTLTRVFGVVGPAIGSVLTVGLLESLLLPLFACRLFGFSPMVFLSRSYGSLLPVLAISLFVALLASTFLQPPLASHPALYALVCLVFTVCAGWGVWAVATEDGKRLIQSRRASIKP